MSALLFIAIIGITTSSFILSRLITESSFRIPELLDFKPFNCRKCLTFHSIWILNTILGLIVQNYIVILIGFIIALASYYLIKKEEESKWE